MMSHATLLTRYSKAQMPGQEINVTFCASYLGHFSPRYFVQEFDANFMLEDALLYMSRVIVAGFLTRLVMTCISRYLLVFAFIFIICQRLLINLLVRFSGNCF